MRERRGVNRVLVRKPVGNKPLGTPWHRWEDNIKMNPQEVGWGHGLDLSDSGQRQMAGICKCGNELSRSIK